MTFSEFFWRVDNWDLTMNLVLILISSIYLLFTGPFSSKISNAEKTTVSQKNYFLLSMIVYYVALGSPLALMAREMFSMHMLQMSLLYIVFPPLFLLGMPGWVFRPLLRIKFLRKIGKFFTKPLIIVFLFNGLLSAYHIPLVFEVIISNRFNHDTAHVILLITALAMWWSIVCPIPKYDRMKPLYKLGYMCANAVLLTPACAIIMFAGEALFPSYSKMSLIFPYLDPVDDQQLGGVIMKIVQEIVYITAIVIIFTRWLKEERAKDELELAEWKKSQKASTV